MFYRPLFRKFSQELDTTADFVIYKAESSKMCEEEIVKQLQDLRRCVVFVSVSLLLLLLFLRRVISSARLIASPVVGPLELRMVLSAQKLPLSVINMVAWVTFKNYYGYYQLSLLDRRRGTLS